MKACVSPILVRRVHNFNNYQKLLAYNVNRYNRTSLAYDEVSYEYMEVPCGKCLPCLAKKSDEWSMRLLHENTLYGNGTNAMFVTLTYREECLPENSSLSKRDVQLFYKNLRYHLGSRKIKYFTCGEYGMKFGRPHYHAIIFGMSYFNKLDHYLINKCWNKGHTDIGTVSTESIVYTTKYMQKDNRLGFNDKTYFALTGKQKPFRLMSQGLGKEFAIKNMESILKNMRIAYNGTYISIPRQYLKWYYKLTGDDSIKKKIQLFAFENKMREVYKYSKQLDIPMTVKVFNEKTNTFAEMINPIIDNIIRNKAVVRRRHFDRQNEEYIAKKMNEFGRKSVEVA